MEELIQRGMELQRMWMKTIVTRESLKSPFDYPVTRNKFCRQIKATRIEIDGYFSEIERLDVIIQVSSAFLSFHGLFSVGCFTRRVCTLEGRRLNVRRMTCNWRAEQESMALQTNRKRKHCRVDDRICISVFSVSLMRYC